ncbi:MAG TPA: glycosyltransferase [Chthoniobacterales bacterium]
MAAESDPYSPALSVIIACYNEGKMMLEAIASAESNNRGRHEIIVVNDGSTDPDTLEVLKGVEQRGIRVIHQANARLPGARNTGIRHARGRYILPLDADNRLRPEYIDRGIDILDAQPSIDVVYGDPVFFGEWSGRKRVNEFDLRYLISGNYIDACAVFRKSAWERVGGYDENIPGGGAEDWDLWVRLGVSGSKFYHVDEVLFEYCVRHDSLTMRMRESAPNDSWKKYLLGKQLTVTWGHLSDTVSWNQTAATFRAAPLRTLARLVVSAYAPGLRRFWQRRR